MPIPAESRKVGVGLYSRLLCGQCRARECLPDLKSFAHFLTVLGSGQPMPARTEVLCDGTLGREETQGVARGLEPLHTPLPLAGRLVRVLGASMQIRVSAMFHPGKNPPLGGSIALHLVGNDHARDVAHPLEQLAEELLGPPLIPPAFHQDIQHFPVLTARPPQIVMLAL